MPQEDFFTAFVLHYGARMNSSPFGHLPGGEPVELYTLANARGSSAGIITYGATVASLRVPDRAGRLDDVVLGFDNLTGYLAPHPYIGAIAGRVAGRLGGARFHLDGQTYDLAVTDPPNHLHGGVRGFNRRNWQAAPVSRPDGADSLRLSYRSPEGEEGYPGTVDVAVTYTLTADDSLIVETEAITDRATPFSITQHSYFNLSGEGSGSVENHRLQILAADYAPTDHHLTLQGRRAAVAGRPNDFNSLRRLGDSLAQLHQAHGDLYFLRSPGHQRNGTAEVAAQLYDPASGRLLTLSTNEDCLQLYTGSGLDGTLIGKSGRPYLAHGALCLECEGYPDGPNSPELGDIILRPGQTFRRQTVFTFSTE